MARRLDVAVKTTILSLVELGCKSRRENVPVSALYEGGMGGLKMYHWYPFHRLEKDDLRRGEGCTAWSYTDEFVKRVWLMV